MPAAAPSQPYGFPSWPRAISTTNPNDDRGDHHEAGECGCVDVDHPEALVAAVAAQAADRLAAAAEQDQRPERRQDPERDEAGTGIAADHCAASITSPSATATSGRNHFVLVICIEHLLDRYVEVAGERERELERRDVAPRLDRVDRLSRHAERLRKLALREKCVQPPFAYTVFHLLM